MKEGMLVRVGRGCSGLVASGVLLLMLGMAPVAQAEQAFGYRLYGSPRLDGFEGNQGIRTDPATVNGIGYVHSSQMDIGDPGNMFVAVGTAKGVGVDNCANDYDSLWTVYEDGVIGGVYFCNDLDVDAYGANTSPSFSITRGACQGGQRWLMEFGGTRWDCIVSGVDGASRAIGLLETTGGSTTDRNIDVKFKNLATRDIGSTWDVFGTASTSVDPNYSVSVVSTLQFNVFLPPLD